MRFLGITRLGTLALAALAALLISGGAQADPGHGSISGLVTDELSNPIEGAFVDAFPFEGGGKGGGALTGLDGTYTITGLAPDSYRVYVFADDYVNEFYDNTTDITQSAPVLVEASTVTPGIDFSLSGGGGISGFVTDDLGSPIEGAMVDAVLAAGCCSFGVAITAADGSYTIDDLPGSSYLVLASATGFASEYFDDTTDASLATPVSVTVGTATPGIDLALSACDTPWSQPAGDDDCDGFETSAEEFVGTDPLNSCSADSISNNETPDAWPPDFNDDQAVNIIDVGEMRGMLNSTSGDGTYAPRQDLTADGAINILDVGALRAFFGSSCG